MPSDAKLESCPYCGGACEVEPSLLVSSDLTVRCMEWGCCYGSLCGRTEAEAITAHNTLCRKLAMFGELVAALRGVLWRGTACGGEPTCVSCGRQREAGHTKKCEAQTLLARAAQLENGGESDGK